MHTLMSIGWTEEFSQKWQQLNTVGMQPARVMADFGTSLRVSMPEIRMAELSGKLAHYANRQDVPKVGDWVAIRSLDHGHNVIEEVIPRHSEFARKIAGKQTVKQVIAANVDMAFIVLALDDDFSIERIERYVYQLSTDNIEAVIILNKADKTDRVDSYVVQLRELGLPIIVSSAVNGMGIEEIRAHIHPGRTAILLGSSGVGKSTLTNQLIGTNTQRTQSIRSSDSTGKHTTVHRELFVLPNGGLLIDTPGIRELQLWGTQKDLDENYDDITLLVACCRYKTCQHQHELGCAIKHAIHAGTLSARHFAHYQKMKLELGDLKARNKARHQQNNKMSYRSIHRQASKELKEAQDEVNYS